MSGYTKLFGSILASTIWRSDNETRIVWITMLAMSNRRGIVEASIPGLADFARVPIDACQRALAHLASPDEFSRTKDHDGRRIEDTDGGWRLLNHNKYRDLLSAEERREYKKVKQREYRGKKRAAPVDKPVDTNSTGGQSGHIATATASATPPSTVKQKKKAVPSAPSSDELRKNLRIITKIAHEVLQKANGHRADVDAIEAIKVLCARRHIAYNSAIVRKALDSAEAQS